MPLLSEPETQKPKLSLIEERELEKARRRKEFIFAAVAFIMVLIFTSIQLNQFRSGDALFVIMFNINFVLLLGILYVVVRNGLKLILERRRKVLGSRLRTRLVVAFVGFSLLPCLLMLLVTTKYVQLSMDFWFKDQVENSMESALDVARGVYDKTGKRLIVQIRNIESDFQKQGIDWESVVAASILEHKLHENNLAVAGFYSKSKGYVDLNASGEMLGVWKQARELINWEQVKLQGYQYLLVPSETSDFIFGVAALGGNLDDFLVLAEDMGAEFKSRLDRIARGAGEYKNLRKIKKPLKLMLYSSLGVLTALIILGAVWFGFRVAREISAPVNALAKGTAAIAKGDLSVRLADNSKDELGLLIQSFNRMAEDLEQSRKKIVDSNAMLEEQNIRIEEHSRYIETVMENIAAGVISFDKFGVVTTINKAACSILHLTSSELLEKNVVELFPEHYAVLATKLEEQRQKHLDMHVQYHMTWPVDGEDRQLLVNVVGFSKDDAYQGAVAVFEDISELERMQRMAAWREVARRIAHEIKNPLTPIKLSAQRLSRKFGAQVSDPAFQESTKVIERQVEHLQEMVQEFSAFAKMPEVKLEKDALEPVLQALAQLFRDGHSKIRWDVNIPELLPLIMLDKNAMHRAILNILTNSAEVLQESCTPEPFVCISAVYHKENSVIRIDIEDNGPGLTSEERSRLFEPYFTHKKGGTGLGLAIVRSIIADHHGYIKAMARAGGGTIMSIDLPVT